MKMVKNPTFDYQRNGIAGDGFFQVHFTTEQSSYRSEDIKLVAVIFDDIDYIREYVDATRVMNPKCGVVNPKDPSSHWRGDNFAGVLYPLLIEWYDEKYGTPSPEPRLVEKSSCEFCKDDPAGQRWLCSHRPHEMVEVS